MFDRIYLEITNICNLNCSFCHKTKRTKKMMSEEEFDVVLSKIEGKGKHLFFHIMGEPTLHPKLPIFIEKARQKGFLPAITTNGTLFCEKGEALLSSLPYKISISLHATESNDNILPTEYYRECVDFAKKASSCGCFVALRLWNLGSCADNSQVLDFLHKEFPNEWESRRNGSSQRLDTRIFLEWGERFEWPDSTLEECDPSADMFCYGLREQIGILVDGTVVPCCLDAEGEINLGNIFENELEDIISSKRARAIYDGFTKRCAYESLCRKCGYAKRFSK